MNSEIRTDYPSDFKYWLCKIESGLTADKKPGTLGDNSLLFTLYENQR